MPDIHSVAVFCGASNGNNAAHAAAARQLGTALAKRAMRLIYGGGQVGLMGAVADAAIAGGGTVIGVIPEFLTRWEIAHNGLAELIITDSMHSRKRRMFELADAFVSFAGGLGTLDETFEILTWRQLKLHDKPILICDVADSAAPLLATIEAAIATGFAHPDVRELYEVTRGVPETVERLAALHAAPKAAAALL